MQITLKLELTPQVEQLVRMLVGQATAAPLQATGTTGKAAPALSVVPESIPRKRGRPKKDAAQVEAVPATATAAPAKKKKAAPVEEDEAEEVDEDDEEESDAEDEAEDADEVDDEDETEEDDEDEKVSGDDLKKLKAALKTCSDSIGKAAAVKILLKYGKTSDQVKKSDLPALLKKLKVQKAA